MGREAMGGVGRGAVAAPALVCTAVYAAKLETACSDLDHLPRGGWDGIG
jgi:hypothetical protein